MVLRGLSARKFLVLVVLMGSIPTRSLWRPLSEGDAFEGGSLAGQNWTGQASPFGNSAAPTPNVDQLISSLLDRNRSREASLHQYSVTRMYQVTNPDGKLVARLIASMEYRVPGTKVFTTQSEEGSWVTRRLVLHRLMESEADAAVGRGRRESVLGPENYTFTMLGEDNLGPFHCFVLNAVPRRKDKYLFEGKVWIDSTDFAVVRIAGRPAKNPSFWIKRSDFVRQYQKIGDFWLPERDESVNELRIHGRKILTIEHRDYRVNDVESGEPQSLKK